MQITECGWEFKWGTVYTKKSRGTSNVSEGVTAVNPHQGNLFQQKRAAALTTTQSSVGKLGWEYWLELTQVQGNSGILKSIILANIAQRLRQEST